MSWVLQIISYGTQFNKKKCIRDLKEIDCLETITDDSFGIHH